MKICRILQADTNFRLCYETLWRVFWFLNLGPRKDKRSRDERIFCPLYRGFSEYTWYRSGRATSAAPKACPVTALLVLGHITKWSGTEFSVRSCQVPYTHSCSQCGNPIADTRFHLWSAERWTPGFWKDGIAVPMWVSAAHYSLAISCLFKHVVI